MRWLNDSLRKYPIILLIPVIIFVVDKTMSPSSIVQFVEERSASVVGSNLTGEQLVSDAAGRAEADAKAAQLQRERQERLSQYHAIICAEDMQHIKEITGTNVEMGGGLSNTLYKSVTRPIQMACKNLVRMGKLGWNNYGPTCGVLMCHE